MFPTMKLPLRMFCCLLFTIALPSSSLFAQESWSRRMADAAMSRWPDGQVTRNGDKIDEWAYDKNVLFAGLADIWSNTADPQYFRYVQRAMDGLVGADGSIASYKPDEVSLD